jgi:hypothetical protein
VARANAHRRPDLRGAESDDPFLARRADSQLALLCSLLEQTSFSETPEPDAKRDETADLGDKYRVYMYYSSSKRRTELNTLLELSALTEPERVDNIAHLARMLREEIGALAGEKHDRDDDDRDDAAAKRPRGRRPRKEGPGASRSVKADE